MANPLGTPGNAAGRDADVEDLGGVSEVDRDRLEIRPALAAAEAAGGDEEVEQPRLGARLDARA